MRKFFYVVVFSVLVFAQEKEVSLNEAIKIALENNKQTKISKLALEIAEVQYEQALSANYPAINAMVVGQRLKEDKYNYQRGTFTLPNNLAYALAAANGGQPLSSIPANIDAKILGRDTVKSSLKILYPLFTGGKISSVIEQAKLNKLLSQNTITRAQQDVIFDIKKYFYGYVLTDELFTLANNTLDTMKFVESITKQFYENGTSLNIKKTDYLSVQITVSLIESVVAKLEANKAMLRSALANAMGLSWDSEIKPVYTQDTLLPPNYILSDLVKKAYETNSDIKKMDIALKISDEKIKEAKSGHYPNVALLGEVSHAYNSYEYGYLNKDQANSWNIGFAVDIPLFDGFRTTNKVNEEKLGKKKMYLFEDMLKEGIALQIKNELTKASIGYKQIQTLKKSKDLAKENSKLNIKGYQIDAIETEKVVQAQYIEAYVKADYFKYVHDYLLSLSTIDRLIGEELK